MAKGFAVRVLRSDVQMGDRKPTFKRWAIYLGNDPVADIEATCVPGYAPRISIITAHGRVLLSKRAKAAR